MKSKLDVDLIATLNSKFEEKNWNQIFNYDTFFERYCSFLEKLDPPELNVALKLIKNYTWITGNQYLGLLIKALEKLSDFEYLNLDNVFILPILSRNDRQKNKEKSSRHVAYLFKTVEIKYNPTFENTRFQIIDDLKQLPKQTKIEGNSNPVILVDDYIGTGETALDAIEELYEYQEYESSYVFLLSLVTQEKGLELLTEKGLNVLSGELRNRGISDNYDEEERVEMLEIMNKLEDKLNIQKEFKLGYKASEALLTMIRTPNNTFPIYWHESKLKNGQKWVAPFPR